MTKLMDMPIDIMICLGLRAFVFEADATCSVYIHSREAKSLVLLYCLNVTVA